MKETIIKKSKKNTFFIFLICLIFIFGGILMMSDPRDSIEYLFGIISIIFFSLGLIILIGDLISNKYLIIINENGFINNSNSNNIGLVSWQNVDLIYTRKIYSSYFIQVDIKNMDELLQCKSNSRRKMSKMLRNSSIILLQSKKQLNQTFKIMMEYYEQYGKGQEN